MNRDLIIATRHLLQSDLRTAFFSGIETVLNKHALMRVCHRSRSRCSRSVLTAAPSRRFRSCLGFVHTYYADVHDPALAFAIARRALPRPDRPDREQGPDRSAQGPPADLTRVRHLGEVMVEVQDEWMQRLSLIHI